MRSNTGAYLADQVRLARDFDGVIEQIAIGILRIMQALQAAVDQAAFVRIWRSDGPDDLSNDKI